MAEDIPDDVRAVLQKKSSEDAAITVRYKNHRGEIDNRRIIPINFFHGNTKYHSEEQWLLRVWDLGKKDYRTYALKDIEEWIKI